MLTNHRVIFKDNTVLRDLSIKMNEYLSGTETIAFVAGEDSIYIGSDLPFNHRWVEVSTANDVASVVSVSLWNGSEWKAAVDVIDQTSTNGVTLAQSGIISWTPDKDHSWMNEDSTEDISDLSTLKIYDMYWVKISFSVSLKATTALKYVGYKFSSDEQLTAEYPELASSSLKDGHTTGKTSWNDQAFVAAEYIVADLKSMNIIWNRNQIIDWPLLKMASIHKTAEIVFRAFGAEYQEEIQDTHKAYRSSLNMKMFHVDLNRDARLTEGEKLDTVGFLSR